MGRNAFQYYGGGRGGSNMVRFQIILAGVFSVIVAVSNAFDWDLVAEYPIMSLRIVVQK